jgi:hypothetical protein
MFRLGRDIEIQETDDHMMQLGFVQFTYTAAEDHDSFIRFERTNSS